MNDSLNDDTAESLINLAKELISVAETIQTEESFDLNNFNTKSARSFIAKQATLEYKSRQMRHSHFSSSIFSEPAWDVILDLAIAEYLGKPISVSSACIASNAPPTTALRWIFVLESQNLVRRYSDFSDRRRTFIRLTDSARRKLFAYFTNKHSVIIRSDS